MASKPLRFLHAANLQLDCPLRGTGPLDDEIREVVDTATLTAFDRVVSTAIDKDVDALLVTGNTFDASYPSLAADVAMRDGFSRLAERQIPVFVTPGELDPAAAWLDHPKLTDNVTIFTDDEEAPVDLTDRGRLVATFLPVTADSSIEPQELSNILGGRTNSKGDRPFIVGLLLTDRSTEHSDRIKFSPNRFAALDWLACPAGTRTDSLPLTDGHIHKQAAPQGLTALDVGTHGVTLLEVDSQRKTRRTSIPLAPVRWERLIQPIDGVKSRDDLLERMLAQLERLPDFKGEQVRIVHWQLDRTSGDAHGWDSDVTATELATSLTELSDQPDGLRYVHRVRAVEPDLTLIEPGHREVLTEFLLSLERHPDVDPATRSKWFADARVADVLTAGRWEHWTESTGAAEIKGRAQKLGWKWFSTIGKKSATGGS
jgi:hypothetical protein